MRDLIIVGGSGFSKEVIWLANDIGQYNIVGILDDSIPANTVVAGIPVLGKILEGSSYAHCEFVVAIGNPRVRKMLTERLLSAGVSKFATLIHPSVKMSKSVSLGEGSIVCAGSILTVDIAIGKHAIININTTVGHDCRFGDFCTVAPIAAISGNVKLGDLVEVGTGACIRQGVQLESGSMLGMGSVLTKSIPANQIFVGNPAAFFKSF